MAPMSRHPWPGHGDNPLPSRKNLCVMTWACYNITYIYIYMLYIYIYVIYICYIYIYVIYVYMSIAPYVFNMGMDQYLLLPFLGG